MTAVRAAPDVTVVTGAGGWLGRALLHALSVGSHRRDGVVRALVHEPGDVDVLAADGVHVVVGDVARPDTLTPLFDRLEGVVDVVHAAGVIHPRRTAQFEQVNATGTRNVLDAARRAGVRRLVHVSSNSPFGTNPLPTDRFRAEEPYDPYYGYGRSKMRAELAVHDAVENGLDAVIVRPPWFYGPHQPPRQTTFFRMVRRGRFPIIGAGDQVRSMVYVGNLVDGVVRAELGDVAPGRAWWIADARPYTVTEIVDTVGAALRDEGYDVVPNRLRLPALTGRVAELADGLIQRAGRYQQQLHVLGEMDKHIACDISAARHELGYEPEVALHEGMRRSIRWCRDQGFEL